uniref:RRM domain-containing protein n=1 Tax=Panagrolaimus davidi TaxID=227884 RepID=A0A914PLR1_9BILA
MKEKLIIVRIPIDILLRFKHLRELTSSPAEVIDALRNRSELVEVSADDDCVRRNPEKPEGNHDEVLKDYKRRSVYIGGFPLRTTFDQLKAYLEMYGNVPSFVTRRDSETQQFRGSIFATFETEQLAQQFLANPTAGIYHGRFLDRKMQLDYEQYRQRKIQLDYERYYAHI